MHEDQRKQKRKPSGVLEARITVTAGLLAERGFLLLDDLADLLKVRPSQLLPSSGFSVQSHFRLQPSDVEGGIKIVPALRRGTRGSAWTATPSTASSASF